MFKCTKCKEPPYAARHVRWGERSEDKGNRRKTPKILCFPPTRFVCCRSARAVRSCPVPSRPVLSCHIPSWSRQPRVPPSCVWQGRVPPATPACSPGTRPSLRRHPLAGGGMSPHATLPRLPHEPSGRGSPFMDNREAADLLGDHTLSYFGGH